MFCACLHKVCFPFFLHHQNLCMSIQSHVYSAATFFFTCIQKDTKNPTCFSILSPLTSAIHLWLCIWVLYASKSQFQFYQNYIIPLLLLSTNIRTILFITLPLSTFWISARLLHISLFPLLPSKHFHQAETITILQI